MIWVFVQDGVAREPEQDQFVQELNAFRFRSSFRTEEGLQYQVDRALRRVREGVVWTPSKQATAERFIRGVLPQARSVVGDPAFVLGGYPACTRREMLLPEPAVGNQLINTPGWRYFIGGSTGTHGLDRVEPSVEGLALTGQGYAQLPGIGLLRTDGAAWFASRAVGVSWNGTGLGILRADPDEAEYVQCTGDAAQTAIWSGVNLLKSWWESAGSAIDGQAWVAWALTGATRMVLPPDVDPQGGGVGLVGRGVGLLPMQNPGPAGVEIAERGVWTSVRQVVEHPETVARHLVVRLWHTFHYPNVAGWIPPLK